MMALVALLTFLLPVGARKILGHVGVPAHEWNAIFVSFTDVLLIALFVFALASRRVRQMVLPVHAPVIALFFFLAAVGISVAGHGVDPLSVFRYAKLLLFAAFALFVRSAVRSGKGNFLVALLVAVALFESVLAVSQFFIQGDLGLRILGESPLDSRAAGVAKIDVGSVKIVRAYGTFPHPNVLATYLVAALFGVLALSLNTSFGAKWLAAIFPLMLALFVSFSRSALVAFAFGLVVAAVCAWRYRKSISRHGRTILFGFLYAVSISAILYGALFLPFWQSRAIPVAREGAVVERVFYAEAALAMLRANPFFGAGWGKFSDRLAEYVEPKPIAIPSTSFPLWLLQPVHNIYLLIAAEAGIGAMALFLVFAGTAIAAAVRAGGIARVPFIAGFATLLAAGFFDHFPITIQQGALLFWFFAGILMADRERFEDARGRTSPHSLPS